MHSQQQRIHTAIQALKECVANTQSHSNANAYRAIILKLVQLFNEEKNPVDMGGLS